MFQVCGDGQKGGLGKEGEAVTKEARDSRAGADRRLEAYQRSQNDQEAASVVSMRIPGFRHWRRSEWLPAKGVGGVVLSEEEHLRRLRAYDETDSDVAVAERLGLRLATYWYWHSSQGLPAPSKLRS